MQDSDGDWICAPNNGGDVGDMLDAIDELNALLVALHDAINRPKGVVPKSAERFHQANAEVCDGHQSHTHEKPNSERGARSQH